MNGAQALARPHRAAVGRGWLSGWLRPSHAYRAADVPEGR